MRHASLAATSLGLLAVATCSPVPLGEGERLGVVRGITGDVLLPTLGEAASGSVMLREACAALAASPSPSAETLSTARLAWRRARLTWKAVAPYLFGPGKDQSTSDAIDWSPVDRKKLEDVIDGADPLTPASVAVLGTSRKGFHAIEVLLFLPAATDAEVLAGLSGDEPRAARRRSFVAALAVDVAERIDRLRRAWAPSQSAGIDAGDPGPAGHADLLAHPGRAPSPYATVRAAIDVLVNEAVTVSEASALKLARPLGLASGGEPRPEQEESGSSDHTLDELSAIVSSLRDLYLGGLAGAEGKGISTLVRAKQPALDARVRAAIDLALTRLRAIPRPLRAALTGRDPTVAAAYEGLRGLQRVLATELVANLGAMLKFNDNDGD